MATALSTEQLFNADRAAIKNALTFDHLNRHGSLAGPDGCEVCGLTVEMTGWDCFACENAFNAEVRDTAGLAVRIARAVEAQMDAERGQ